MDETTHERLHKTAEDDGWIQFSEWASDYFGADLWAGFSSGKNTFSLLIGEMKNKIGYFEIPLQSDVVGQFCHIKACQNLSLLLS